MIPEHLRIPFAIAFAVAMVGAAIWHELKERAKRKHVFAMFEANRRAHLPAPGSKRLIVMKEGKRPCVTCGAPLNMGDGHVLTQYSDGSLGCEKHYDEPGAP